MLTLAEILALEAEILALEAEKRAQRAMRRKINRARRPFGVLNPIWKASVGRLRFRKQEFSAD